MATELHSWWLIIAICWTSAAAVYAGVCSKRAGRSTSLMKRLASAELRTTELESAFSELMDNWKRLRSREGMRELRSRRAASDAPEAPPFGTPKEELRRHYGLSGKSAAEVASLHLNKGS
jgi:hypothetical protein